MCCVEVGYNTWSGWATTHGQGATLTAHYLTILLCTYTPPGRAGGRHTDEPALPPAAPRTPPARRMARAQREHRAGALTLAPTLATLTPTL